MNTAPYSGSLTAEQFLFYEIRIASKLYAQGISVDEAISRIKADNLFQYPTEREVARMTRACYRRLDALNNRDCQANQPLCHYAVQSTGLGFYDPSHRRKVSYPGLLL